MSVLWLIWRRSGEGTCVFVFKVADCLGADGLDGDGLDGDGLDGEGLFIHLCADGG